MRLRSLVLLASAVALWAQASSPETAWKKLRQAILADEAYFEMLKANTVPVTEGYIVSMEPKERPHTIFIGIETPLVAELKLQITRDGAPARLPSTPPRKAKVYFRSAVVESYTKRPFALTATTDENGLDFEEASQ